MPFLVPMKEQASTVANAYAARASLFTAEKEWRFDGAGVSSAPLGRRIDWKDILEIRLIYAPTRFERRRYICRISPLSGACETIPSMHFSGPGAFEDRGSSYRAFVLGLVREAARQNPAIRFAAGETWIKYLANAGVLVVSFSAVLFLLLDFGIDPIVPEHAGVQTVVIVKLILLLAAIPIAWAWLRRNRARTFDPSAIPRDLLPD